MDIVVSVAVEAESPVIYNFMKNLQAYVSYLSNLVPCSKAFLFESAIATGPSAFAYSRSCLGRDINLEQV